MGSSEYVSVGDIIDDRDRILVAVAQCSLRDLSPDFQSILRLALYLEPHKWVASSRMGKWGLFVLENNRHMVFFSGALVFHATIYSDLTVQGVPVVGPFFF